jgi:hypothetical protein
MEKNHDLIDPRKKRFSSEIEVLNYSNGETIDYPFVLLQCQLQNDSTLRKEDGEIQHLYEVSASDSDLSVVEKSRKIQVLVKTRDKCRSWPVIRGGFKALVQLIPGDNDIKIIASISEQCQIEKDFHLVYKPSTLPRYLFVHACTRSAQI